MDNQALERAIAVVGTQQRLADSLGLKSPSITEWRKRGRVPAERCLDIEGITNGAVTRYDLRPDVFGQPKPTKPTHERRAG